MKVLKRVLPFAVIVGAALLLLYLPDLGPERYTGLSTYFQTERGRQGFVGYTVAAVKDGVPVYAEAFGSDGRGLPLSLDAPMPLGPLGSSFTGMLALGLQRDGLLDIDRPLAEYLPELEPGMGAEPAPTLRHFLTHTSGFDNRDFDDRHRKAPDLARAVGQLAAARPRGAPGEVFRPIDTGYQALGLVMQRVTGKEYASLVAERIFGPLGMTSSRAELVQEELVPTGSSVFFGAVLPQPQELPRFAFPSGALISTAPDMAKYLAFIAAPNPAVRLPLPAATATALRVPLVPGIDFSYGWHLERGGAGLRLWQDGGLEAFSAAAAVWPDSGVALVIMAPQSSLLQARVALPALMEGGRRILMEGSTDRLFPLGRLSILLAVAAAVHLMVLAAQTGNALAWVRDKRSLADASGKDGLLRFAGIRTILGAALRIALLIFLPRLLQPLLDRRVDWTTIFTLLPDLGGWLVAALVFGLLRNLTRLAWLRRPSRLFSHRRK